MFLTPRPADLIAAFGFVARKSRVVITLTDSSCPVGIYRLVRNSGARGQLVESCLPYAIASYGIERGYIGSGDCSDATEPVVKSVGAVSGDRLELSRNSVNILLTGEGRRDRECRSLLLSYLRGSVLRPFATSW